jgi:hypothetical protein
LLLKELLRSGGDKGCYSKNCSEVVVTKVVTPGIGDMIAQRLLLKEWVTWGAQSGDMGCSKKG